MECRLETNGEITLLVLEGDVTIQDVGRLKEVIVTSLQETRDVHIDLAAVGRTDLSLLQLICSAHRTAHVSGKSVTLRNGQGGTASEMATHYGLAHRPACVLGSKESCLWRADDTCATASICTTADPERPPRTGR